jgi:two-component system phosphate regulon sensor histidine kinase PhoR
MQSFDVKTLIDEAVNAYEPLREPRQVRLDISIAPGIDQIICDGGAIKDSVINLLSNAYKYGGEPPHIRISVALDDEDVRIAVADNGSGIDRREHKRIFDKFYRIDDRLSRERDGSGLGLAIVQHVMKAHGGHVEVDSEIGRHSTFTLVIPHLQTTTIPPPALKA